MSDLRRGATGRTRLMCQSSSRMTRQSSANLTKMFLFVWVVTYSGLLYG